MMRSLLKVIVTAGSVGYEKLAYKGVVIPEIMEDEVLVDFDMRDMYLKNITLIGTTAREGPVVSNLVKYVELGKLDRFWPRFSLYLQ